MIEDRGDPAALGHAETGLHYRADLPSTVPGDLDLRIEIEDASGNSASVTFDDALSVGVRRRAMRR